MNVQGSAAATRVKLILLAIAVAGTVFIVGEHRTHVIPYLPWLLLAACPLMHLFMHHRRGNHGPPDESDEGARVPPRRDDVAGRAERR